MASANEIVLSLLACIESPHIVSAIEKKDYMLKVQKLENYDKYIDCEEIKEKKVTRDNFQKCFSFTIARLQDVTVRTYLQKQKICNVTFYKKNTQPKDLLSRNAGNGIEAISTLTKIIVKHEISGSNLVCYIHPVSVYKNRLLTNKEMLLDYFNKNDEKVENLIVKYILNDSVLDDLSESLLDLGYTPK